MAWSISFWRSEREGGERYVSEHSREQGDQNAHGFHVEFVGLLLGGMRHDYIHHRFNECVGRLSICTNESS